jgi:asparagine synthase (glutamine-hydrolysing)
MCGIAGYWNLNTGRPACRAVIGHMVRALTHRGPDEDGYWVEGAFAFGMRRLRVIDPAGGKQPATNEDASVQVVFNGEIYNHRELRSELTKRGHVARTRSDTEVIAHAWEEWGPACVERFNGMFAIAVWDRRREELFLVRDRLGIKPLYVYEGSDGVVFGSELKAVVRAPEFGIQWDMEAVDDFLTYEFVPAPLTIVKGVRKVPAGTWLLYRAGGVKRRQSRRYWALTASGAAPRSPDEAAEELRQRLQTSVRRRLIADVPLGAFLSGGIDSSIIVSLMATESPDEVRSFSLGFEDRSYNELPYARLVANAFGTRHREAMVAPQIGTLAGKLASYFDEPFGDVSAFPTYMISELARREVTVALSGDGGDELFAGYDHYRAHRWAARLRRVTAGWPWQVISGMLDFMPPTPHKKGLTNKAKRFVSGTRLPPDLEHARWWIFQDLAERRRLYTPSLEESLGDRDPFGYYRGRMEEGTRHGFRGLQRQLYADVTGYLTDDILVKLDRMSMAVSLEARVPFLDHEVVEYAMTIPSAWKLANGTSKWILKYAFRDRLPAPVQRRGKEGFSMPMKNWIRGPLQPLVQELLSERRVRERGWFEAAEVRRLLREHMSGRQNHAHRLWCLLSIELSLDSLLGSAAQRPPLEEAVRS